MKKIIKSICFSLLAFIVAIGSIFLPVGQKNQKYANADVTFEGDTNFISSNLMQVRLGFVNSSRDLRPSTPFSQLLSSNWGLGYNTFLNTSFRLSVNTFGSINFYYISSRDSNYYYGSNYDNWNLLTSLYPDSSSSREHTWSALVVPFYDSSSSFESLFACSLFAPDDYDGSYYPSLQMVSVEIGSSYDFESMSGIDMNFIDNMSGVSITNAHIVSYVDTTGFRFSFALPCWVEDSSYYYSYRKYFLTDSLDLSNNDAYNQGYNNGRADGITIGENQGYTSGYNTGYDDGFEVGKIEGVLDSNNYSFFGLFSAIFDAPVKILTSLFNFEFLGVNLWAFFTSILTISLIVFVIRKFMAKG